MVSGERDTSVKGSLSPLVISIWVLVMYPLKQFFFKFDLDDNAILYHL